MNIMIITMTIVIQLDWNIIKKMQVTLGKKEKKKRQSVNITLMFRPQVTEEDPLG